MAGLELSGREVGPLVDRLDQYYEDPNLVKVPYLSLASALFPR